MKSTVIKKLGNITTVDKKGDKMEEIYKPERRFHATLEMRELLGYANVVFDLFKGDPENNKDTIDFEKAIKNYVPPEDGYDHYAETALRESFTWEEIEAMREYFMKWGNDYIFDFFELSIPVSNGTCGPSAFGVGGSDRQFIFNTLDGYPLSFSVIGHCDFCNFKRA